ncbi:Sporulation protein YpjB (SpoYpjB) [Geobacillus sp. BCO2]|nr:Sporulation protein YpjB (SpoYpjB) [Geobacillus sp. BCO2]
MAKNGRFAEAKEVLRYFSDRFFSLGAKERLKSADELRAVTVTHEQAVKAMTAPISAEDKVAAITQFRLVVDAIHSTYQPLWTEMEPAVMERLPRSKRRCNKASRKRMPLPSASCLTVIH